MKTLDKLPIKTMIVGNSATILLLLVIAAGVGIIGLTLANTSFGEYRQLARQTNTASVVQAEEVARQIWTCR